MINSKSDYYDYLNQDKKALGIKPNGLSGKITGFISPNYIYIRSKLYL